MMLIFSVIIMCPYLSRHKHIGTSAIRYQHLHQKLWINCFIRRPFHKLFLKHLIRFLLWKNTSELKGQKLVFSANMHLQFIFWIQNFISNWKSKTQKRYTLDNIFGFRWCSLKEWAWSKNKSNGKEKWKRDTAMVTTTVLSWQVTTTSFKWKEQLVTGAQRNGSSGK